MSVGSRSERFGDQRDVGVVYRYDAERIAYQWK
jgi:hypothetical protein